MIRIVSSVLIALLSAGAGLYARQKTDDGTDLLEKIEKARAALGAEHVEISKGVVGTRRVRVGRRKFKTVPIIGIISREMAIAVLDGRGNISIARAVKYNDRFDVQTPGITLSVRRENGINSDFACLRPAGGRILAVKYPVSNERGRFGPGDETLEVVYTPYSGEIATDAVVDEGIDVQRKMIDRAYHRLKERQVTSRAFPGRYVASVIPKDIVTVLLVNEHIDPGQFIAAGLAEPLAKQVLTIIATNEERAYAYSISPAGARGLVQMIPSTYALMRNKYPEARLNPDFSAGMTDSVNALVAQVLLCDSDWQTIRSRADIPASRIGPYLAAAYNGGVRRVISILDDDETDWMEAPDSGHPTTTVTRRVRVRSRSKSGRVRTTYVVKRYTQPIFRSETSKYVRQYHWIHDFFVKKGVKGFGRAAGVDDK